MATLSHEIAAITCDVDGTLYDLPRQKLLFAKHAVWHPKVIAAWEREKDDMRGHHFENYDSELNRRISSSLKIPVERVEKIMEKLFKEKWLSTFNANTPLKGVKQLVKQLSEGLIPIGIISDHASVEKLKRMGLDGLWSVNIDCSALGSLKPRTEGIVAAAYKFGCEPRSILQIGDRADTDCEMADAVGARCLLRGRDWKNIEELGVAISNITSVKLNAH